MHKTVIAGIVLLFSTTAEAAMTSSDADWEQAMEVPCPALMTEQECLVHKDTLAFLDNAAERDAYLTNLGRLLRERNKSCECAKLIIEPRR